MISQSTSSTSWSQRVFESAQFPRVAPRKHNPFTVFSKAVRGSIGLSFGRSAGDYCDRSCRLWGACYATRIERIYTGLRSKLAAHYAGGPIWVVNQALARLTDKPIPWARLSVDGSLPARGDLPPRQWRAFGRKLRELILRVKNRGADWHIPVESIGKARSYRSLLRGTGVVVRRTSQSTSVSDVLRSKVHRAWVVANSIHNGAVRNDEKEANVALAQFVAKEIRSSGQSAVVCPAIAGSSKCGQCRACASDKVDVVLYPFHP